VVNADFAADTALFLLKILVETPIERYPGDTDAARRRSRILLAMPLLEDVEKFLNNLCLCVVTLAAESLALRGGSADPTAPLADIQHLGQQDASEKAAVGRLNSGRVFAGVAWEVAGWCRGHMSMASVLVDSPIENSLILAEREYNNAYTAVTRARHLAEEAKAELTAARQILAC
jgi:hypothetical protein